MPHGVLRALTWRMGSLDFSTSSFCTQVVYHSLFMAFIILMSSITCTSHKTSHKTWSSISYTSFVGLFKKTYVMYWVLIVDFIASRRSQVGNMKELG